jgi:hypothetical protein
MQFVGDPLVFVFREASGEAGPVAGRLVANFGDYHEFIGTDGQYLFDGVAVTEVGKHVWRELSRQRDPLRQDVGFTHFDDEWGELYWIPALTSDTGFGDADEGPEDCYTEHYLEELGERMPSAFSRRSAPFTASGYSATLGVLTWDELTGQWAAQSFQWSDPQLFAGTAQSLAGDQDGFIWVLNSSQTANGTSLVSNVVTARRPLGDGRIRGLLTRIYAFASELAFPLTITTRTMDHAEATPEIVQIDTFDQSHANNERYFVTPYRRGRYFEIEYGSPGTPWEITGWDVDIRSGGRR